MTFKTTLFAAVAAVAISPAAHAYEGLYGAIGAGLSYNQPDLDTEGAGALAFDLEGDYENGIGIYTALGYAWGNNWRTEVEYSYRQNDARFIAGDGTISGFNPLDGDLTAQAIFGNAIYDFDTGSKVTPYLGGGFGVISFGLDASSNQPNAAFGLNPLQINESGVRRVGVQAIAGLGVALADNLSLDLSYRYIVSRAAEFSGTLAGAPQTLKTRYQNHALFAGLRWNFGAAAPVAPAVQYKDCWDGSSVPVSADCPPQIVEDTADIAEPIQFTVYFDYDKSNLTPEASNLVREAASRALQFDVDTVVIAGNTDTSGGAAYNQRLSERRAAVVRDALIANGIPGDSIRMEANGENSPAKATADGVREPLNRRSEVLISFE